MTDDCDPDWGLLERLLAGECTEVEIEAVRRWAASDAQNEKLLAELQATWSEAGQTERRFDSVAAWKHIAPGIRRGPTLRVVGPSSAVDRSSTLRRPYLRWGLAAAVVLAAGGLVLVRTVNYRPDAAREIAKERTFTSPRGHRSDIKLADGTHVILGPGSVLHVPPGYGVGRREVSLNGEAYFDVRHDAGRPFAAFAGGAVVRDVGTAFTLRSYAEDDRAQVVVASGEVAFGDTRVALHPGDLAQRTPAGDIAVLRGVNVARYLSWTRGELSFDDVPLRSVAADVGRWYDVDIQVTDSTLAARHVTIVFPDPDLTRVLRSLTVALHARYTRDGQVILLSPRKS
jgi:transmembrane sensor